MSKLIFLVFILVTAAYVLAIPKEFHPNVEIIGGQDTDITLHPWQISIRFEDDHICGGFLISDTWVVTAAHCPALYADQVLTIKVGSTYRSTGGEEYTVSQIVIHPDYSSDDYDYDVALFELIRPINNPNASAIALPTENEKLTPGTNLTVTGWGLINEFTGPEAEVLQEVVVPLVSPEDCAVAYRFDKVHDHLLCAGYLGVGGKGGCFGDSGGPVVAAGKVFGIVHGGYRCDSSKYPDLYVNVASHIPWIRNTTGV